MCRTMRNLHVMVDQRSLLFRFFFLGCIFTSFLFLCVFIAKSGRWKMIYFLFSFRGRSSGAPFHTVYGTLLTPSIY